MNNLYAIYFIVKDMKKTLSLLFIILSLNIYSFKANAVSLYATCIHESYAHTFLLLIRTSEVVTYINYKYDGYMIDDPNYEVLRVNFTSNKFDNVNGVFSGDAYFSSGDDSDSAYIGEKLFTKPLKFELDLNTSILKLKNLANVKSGELAITCWDSEF